MISITHNVQKKLEHNKNLLAPMNKVISKLDARGCLNKRMFVFFTSVLDKWSILLPLGKCFLNCLLRFSIFGF